MEFGKGIFPEGFCDFLPGGFEIEMDLSLLGDICKNTKSATSLSLHLLAQVVLPRCVYWLLITQTPLTSRRQHVLSLPSAPS